MSQPTATAAPGRTVADPVAEVHPPGRLPVAEENPIASAATRRFEQLGS
jgi:hypothetical protein